MFFVLHETNKNLELSQSKDIFKTIQEPNIINAPKISIDSPDSKNLACKKCGKVFKQNWMLTRHIIQVENKIKSKCIYCKKEFPRIKEHLKKCKINPLNKKLIKSSKKKEYTFDKNINLFFGSHHFSLNSIFHSIYNDFISNNKFIKFNNFLSFPNYVLGEGAFSIVYFALDEITKQPASLKLQKQNPEKIDKYYYSQESLILMKLKEYISFPNFIYIEISEKGNILVETLFGPTLKKLFSFCNHKFDILTISKIALDIITGLEILHDNGFLLLDLKLDNIGILLKDIAGDKGNEIRVGLIDLGNSVSFKDKNNNHYYQKNFPKFHKGNTFFASVNVLEGKAPSRRDDLESLFYLLLYLYKYDTPWEQYSSIDDKNEYLKNVIKEKKKFVAKNYIGTEYEELIDFYYLIKQIKYKERPNYQIFKKIFLYSINKKNLNFTQPYRLTWEDKFSKIIGKDTNQKKNEEFTNIFQNVFRGYPTEIASKFIEQFH